jgi:membrane associated rhomboid family serine protease
VIFPWRSDAPLYHRPVGTIGLIVVNIMAFAAMVSAGVRPTEFAMPFGHFTPLSWITSAFSHAGIMHLAGNMLFLWTFGLVVEGKIGWRKYLLLYLVLCVLIGAATQLSMLQVTKGCALGASSAIFALMFIALIWAPYNMMDCILWITLRPINFEWPIWGVSLLFVAWNLLEWSIRGFAMSTPALHLTGVAFGAPAALLFLKLRWVDCEGWDLLTVRKQGGPVPKRLEEMHEERVAAHAERKEQSLKLIEGYIKEFDPLSAVRVHRNVEATAGSWKLPDAAVRELTNQLTAKEHWDDAWSYSQLARADSEPDFIITRALIALRRQRPAKALQLLQLSDTTRLDGDQRARRRQIAEEARTMIDAGVLEIMD